MNMIKSALILTFMTIIMYSPTANAIVREGIYIGAGCGATFDNFKFKAENITTGISVHKKQNKTQCIGTAFLGYGYTTCQCFFIGAEVGTNFPRRTLKFNRPGVSLTSFTFNNRLSIQEYVYADLLPGYRFSENCLLYARVGVSYARLNLVLEENPAANVARYSFSKNRCALRLGVGLNYSITEWLGIGIDYCYTDYQKQNTYIALYTATQSQRPQTQSVVVSLIFNFPKNCCW